MEEVWVPKSTAGGEWPAVQQDLLRQLQEWETTYDYVWAIILHWISLLQQLAPP